MIDTAFEGKRAVTRETGPAEQFPQESRLLRFELQLRQLIVRYGTDLDVSINFDDLVRRSS